MSRNTELISEIVELIKLMCYIVISKREVCRLDINKKAQFIIETLKKNGYKAYLVGGCVRDYLMGKEPHDFDITTNALPSETKKVFSDFNLITNGEKHGTVGIIADGEVFEVTTFRKDGDYNDFRHPNKVIFTDDLTLDLSRRDFTINATAISENEIVDPFFGQNDINNEIIRCVGDAKKRFKEDALRILRAMRFSSTLGFKIEEKTKSAMHEKRELILHIKKERITDEFFKMLSGKNFLNVYREFIDIFKVFEPKINENAVLGESKISSLFNLFGDSTESIILDKSTKNKLATIKLYENSDILPERAGIKKLLNKMGKENFKELLLVKKSRGEDIFGQNEIFCDIINKKECFSLQDLAVNGEDLKKCGLTGVKVGNALQKALCSVIEEKTENDKESILLFLRREKEIL